MAKPARCPRCGRDNDPTFAFCLDCGQSLRGAAASGPVLCASCGAKLEAGFRFCGHCGAPAGAPQIAAPPTPPPPQRTPLPGPAAAPPRGEPTAPARPRPAAPPPARPGTGPRVAALRPDGGPGAVFTLEREETLCGRTEGAIRLADDPAVSPRHARFSLRAGALTVEDLGSANGTFLRLRGPHRLSVGEEIRLGRQVLRLEPLPRPVASDPAAVRPWGSPDPGCRFRLTQILDGGGLGEVFPLRPGENLVGREAGAITFPSDRYVSSRHARIEVRDADVTLLDAGSSNGTFVKITGPAELGPGDQLLVGSQLLRVED
ncbi:MAG TPA: FHA domain-containing protein [Anaeromyxobacteraceae bacterium]|nr:FHA domain-containing protein [Anaeromyxobacteraceae bacterium]